MSIVLWYMAESKPDDVGIAFADGRGVEHYARQDEQPAVVRPVAFYG